MLFEVVSFVGRVVTSSVGQFRWYLQLKDPKMPECTRSQVCICSLFVGIKKISGVSEHECWDA